MEFTFVLNVPHVLAAIWACVTAWLIYASMGDFFYAARMNGGVYILEIIVPAILIAITGTTTWLLFYKVVL